MNFNVLTIFVLAVVVAMCSATSPRPLCETNACDASCVSRGFSGGECSTRFLCRCGKIESQVINIGPCSLGRCFPTCFSRGFFAGRCRGGNCECQRYRFY